MGLPVTDTWTSGADQSITAYGPYALLEGSMNVYAAGAGLDGGGGAYNGFRITSETFSTEQFSQCVITADQITYGVYTGPSVRCQSGANTSYHVDCNGSVYYVSKCVAGSQSDAGGGSHSESFAAGDVLRLEVTGTGATVTLSVYKALAASPTSFTLLATYTDTASDRIVTAGTAGGFIYGSQNLFGAMGTWTAGDLGGGGPTYTQSASGSATPSGLLTKKVFKSLLGSTTGTGSAVKKTTKSFAGSSTGAGAVLTAKKMYRAVAGAVTAVGSVATSLLTAGSRTALEFPSNGGSPSAFVAMYLAGADMPNIASLTVIDRYYPFQQNGFYTKFFHGQTNGGFSGGADYFGTHPYPPTGGSSGAVHKWEVSANGGDDTTDENANDTTVTKGQWYSQASVAQNIAGDGNIDYYWDLATDTGRLINTVMSGFPLANSANSPAFTYGDAWWSPQNERLSGYLRGIQIYQEALSLTHISALSLLETDAAVLAYCSANSITSLWYLNMNPTATDVTDKSGNGHDMVWASGSTATTYTLPGGTAYFVAVAGAITATGSLVKKIGKSLLGSSTGVGIEAKLTRKSAFTGSSTPTGGVSFGVALTQFISGSSTASGALVKLTRKGLVGAITATGAVVKKTTKAFSGSITATGGIVRKAITKSFAGAITATGAIASSYRVLQSIAGSATASGSVTTSIIAFVAATGRSGLTHLRRFIGRR